MDYVDLKNMCINTYYNDKICNNNTLLRQILYNTTDHLYLSPNINVANALNDLYDVIIFLINNNYPPDMYYPKWVNRELLIDDMIRKIYVSLYHKITNILYNININKKDNIVDFIVDVINNKLIKVKINKALISFPFSAIEAGGVELRTESNIKNNPYLKYVENILIIPQSFRDYIITPIIKWYQNGYGDIIDLGLENIMFIRPQTFEAYRY